MQLKYCSNSNSGLTLMEVLITLGLLSVLFGLGSQLLQGAFKTMRVQSQKGQANQAMQLALNRICCDVRQAQTFSVPDSTHLQLEILDPAYPTGAFKLNPYASQNLFVVVYSTDGQGTLLRTITPKSGGSSDIQALAQGIQGFGVVWPSPTYSGTLEVSLSINDENLGLRSITSQVFPTVAH